jgi:hypothetical protein
VRRLGLSASASFISALLACAGCSSAGPYGFSRTYSALSAEEAALQGSEHYDPVMSKRLPDEWHSKKLDMFGIVLARGEGRDGLADLTLSIRRLAARNLCEEAAEDTCRVTVGDQELARVHALVKLSQSDNVGNDRVQPRSLVRVVGKLEDQANKEDGADVLLGDYYRHWPPAYFVTEQARSYLRR